MPPPLLRLDGLLLVNKHPGVSSFGIIESLQRQVRDRLGVKRKDLPSLGHGGTLDPFATGLLVVCVGRGVKLARYFLDSDKTYEGVIRFGETTVPGDPTDPISERADRVPSSISEIRERAESLTREPYLQIPPMHSAKKKDGQPLYELARQGIEIERPAKSCRIHAFEILGYDSQQSPPRAPFRVRCSAGTYIRVLAQDLGRMLGSVAMLDSLHRSGSGTFEISRAMSCEEIEAATCDIRDEAGWDRLPGWIPFDRMLDGYPRVEASPEDALALVHGKQHALPGILSRAPADAGDWLAIHCQERLVAMARREGTGWGLERVFPPPPAP